MKLGNMLGFRRDLLIEARFARQHFDFVEVTIQPDVLGRPKEHFSKLADSLRNIEVLGHLHWKITDLKTLRENVLLLRRLGAKRITIHPFACSIAENIKLLSEMRRFCAKNGADLLVENVSEAPFNRAAKIVKIVRGVPGLGVTLDVGHANRTSRKELDRFLKLLGLKIRHLHLHDNIGQFDHLFFRDCAKLKRWLKLLGAKTKADTVLLETFAVPTKKGSRSLDFCVLKKEHLKQLKLLKK